jgi:hypothetical protein
MDNDLISRSALLEESQVIIDIDGDDYFVVYESDIKDAPAVDAVELPKGRPGDYLEWDNGAGHRQIYGICSVMICEDCMRYELASFAPVVGHPGIVRIISREEAEKLVKERMEKEACVTVEAKMEG